MRLALLVVAVLGVSCGTNTATCSGAGSFAICDADEWTSLPTRGVGTRLMECSDGRTTIRVCANGCVIGGTGSDVCR